ncbi:MAG: phosphodiester glycosidase family protein [Acidobacteria bacterium]|nr:phosphodiester glycosidase family protein [Acidobacteriota bacterium]
MDFRRSLLALCLVAGLLSPVAARQSVSHPYAGLTYIEASTTTPRAIKTHVIQVDLSTPGVRVTLTPPGGERETLRQTTVEFVASQRAQAGINAHFFLPFPSTDASAFVIGLAASDGRVYSACETPEQSYALVANAPAINIDRQNRASIVRCGETAELWTTIAGSAQIVTDGRVTIPEYRDAEHPAALLTPGSTRNYANGNSWYGAVNARSVIGISRDGRTLTLFTVDARGGTEGMTVREAAAWVIENHGVWNALNVDGGGSTSLALADPTTGVVSIVNTSSDNPKGRSVASSLAVFAPKAGGR